MDIIVVASTKGGSNKSTISLNLAVEAERQGDGPVIIVDLDPQASLTGWWNRREPATPVLAQVDLKHLTEHFDSLREEGNKTVIVDTPGVMSAYVRKVLALASLVVIPCRASLFDVETLTAFTSIVEELGRDMLFVPSSIKPRTRISADTIRNLSVFGTVANTIHDRVDYAASLNNGLAVSEIRPGGDAANEIEQLWQCVKTRIRKQARLRTRQQVEKHA